MTASAGLFPADFRKTEGGDGAIARHFQGKQAGSRGLFLRGSGVSLIRVINVPFSFLTQKVKKVVNCDDSDGATSPYGGRRAACRRLGPVSNSYIQTLGRDFRKSGNGGPGPYVGQAGTATLPRNFHYPP